MTTITTSTMTKTTKTMAKATTTPTPNPITPTTSSTITTKIDRMKVWCYTKMISIQQQSSSISPIRRHMITCSFIIMMIILLYVRHSLVTSSASVSASSTDVNNNMDDDQISSSISTPTIIKEEQEDDDEQSRTEISSVEDNVTKLSSAVIHNTQQGNTAATKIITIKNKQPQNTISFKDKVNEILKDDEKELNNHNKQQKCNKVSIIYNHTLGKPIWMPGYPGSGYHIIEHIIPRIIGYNALVVYYHHTCDNVIVSYKPPTPNDIIGHEDEDVTSTSTINTNTMIATALCITHWPFIGRDSPKDIEKHDAERYIKNHENSNLLLDPDTIQQNMNNRYHHHVLFVIRNPMYCISSYYTRWYGRQNSIRHNYIQPPNDEWKKWRNSKLLIHLNFWKDMIMKWHNGIDDTSITGGIGMYLPYELLIDNNQGPILLQSIAKYMKDANHIIHPNINNNVDNNNDNDNWTIEDYQCIWNNTIDSNHYQKHKEYIYSYTIEQQELMIQTLDDIILLYPNDDVLIQLLQYYRNMIINDMIID